MPKGRVTGKAIRRSLVVEDRKGCKKLHQCDFLARSEAESDSSKSSSDDDSSSEADETMLRRETRILILQQRRTSLHIRRQTIWPFHIHRQAMWQPEWTLEDKCFIVYIYTLLKRIERQDKKIGDMQSKLSQSSSASTDSTPRRWSASDKRKEVPLEVRVSPQIYNMTS